MHCWLRSILNCNHHSGEPINCDCVGMQISKIFKSCICKLDLGNIVDIRCKHDVCQRPVNAGRFTGGLKFAKRITGEKTTLKTWGVPMPGRFTGGDKSG